MENKEEQKLYTKHHTHILLGICVLFCVSAFLTTLHFQKENQKMQAETEEPLPREEFFSSSPTYQKEFFDNLTLEANSYVVYDIVSGKVLASKNKDAIMPLASITKVATSYMAEMYIKKDSLIVKNFDTLPEGASGIYEGAVWKKEDLVKYTLLVSSNDGARTLARTVGEELGAKTDQDAISLFLEKLNQDLKSFGYKTLYFYNETGLDESVTQGGGYGSAEEVAHFITRLYSQNPTLFDQTYKKESVAIFSGKEKVVQNTNKAADKTQGLLASKTGYTDLAGGNLAVVLDLDFGHPVAIVVLGSTYEGRFQDVEKLREVTLKSMK